MTLGAAPRVWAAIWDQSIFWPDEIMQTLEQAHRMAFHRGLIPWEFRDGARSWFFPGAIGLFWKGLALLGVKHSFGLVVGAKLLMVAMGLLGIEVGRRMAARLAGPTAGLVAALFLAGCPLEIFFGSRVMTEVASGPLVILAAYLAVVAERPRPALAGVLIAAATFLRYQNGLLAAGLLLILILRKDRRAALRYCAAATVVGVAGGLLDWATWGYPFQAFWVYVKFNLIDGKASGFGTAPFDFFAVCLARTLGPALGIVLLGLAASWRRARGLVSLVLVYFLAHSLVPHKELRFLLPIVPLALALAGAGFTTLWEGWGAGPRFPVAVASCCAIAMAGQAATPLRREYAGGASDWPLWHSGEDYIVNVWEAEKKPDLCGVAFVDNAWPWTGGYTYLHRDVPLYWDLNHLASANYVIGSAGRTLPPGWRGVFEYKQYELFHREGTCQPDPGYDPLP
jgi:hypothetical protein